MDFERLCVILSRFMDENPGYKVACEKSECLGMEETRMKMSKDDCFSVWIFGEGDIVEINQAFNEQYLEIIQYILTNLKRILDEECERSPQRLQCTYKPRLTTKT